MYLMNEWCLGVVGGRTKHNACVDVINNLYKTTISKNNLISKPKNISQISADALKFFGHFF